MAAAAKSTRKTARRPAFVETPIFDAMKGDAKLRSMNNRWGQARATADRVLAKCLKAPTIEPTREQREAIAEQNGWY